MEEKIKEIVATFTKLPIDQIGPMTPIGRTAVKSSILLHRMFAKLAEAGVQVVNYADIKVVGDLPLAGNASRPVSEMSPAGQTTEPSYPQAIGQSVSQSVPQSVPQAIGQSVPQAVPQFVVRQPASAPMASSGGIGIDIEAIDGLPRTDDFRKDAFYSMNFTAAEIAYCILQPDPYASFAGLFAVKESIVKADNSYRTKSFNTIAISHSQTGKPLYPGWNISISHAGTMAVAVAIPENSPESQNLPPTSPSFSVAPRPASGWTGWLALAISVIAIIIHFIR